MTALKVRALIVGTDEMFHGWAVAERAVGDVALVIETVGMRASEAADAINAIEPGAFEALVDKAVAERMAEVRS
ncbi:MAG: hypothetical protein ACK52I_01495 [Pseudomonadota bacterium]